MKGYQEARPTLTPQGAQEELNAVLSRCETMRTSLAKGQMLISMSNLIRDLGSKDNRLSPGQLEELAQATLDARERVAELEEMLRFLSYAQLYLKERVDGRYN